MKRITFSISLIILIINTNFAQLINFENFDNEINGYTGCASSQTLSSTFWHNVTGDDKDWVIHSGSTSSNNTSQASNSFSVDPGFNSNTDLHSQSISINNKGIPIVGINTDKEGKDRSKIAPDVGAYEFNPPNDMAIIELVAPQATSIGLNIKTEITVKIANYALLMTVEQCTFLQD